MTVLGCVLQGTPCIGKFRRHFMPCFQRSLNLSQPSGHFMYHKFNIQQFYVLPHSVFMCFMWIWEQTAIIPLYRVNWLGFITVTECVYCAVRTGYLSIVPGNTNLQRLNAQRNVHISDGRPTAQTHDDAQSHQRSLYCTFRRCIFIVLQVATDVTEWNSAPNQNDLNAFLTWRNTLQRLEYSSLQGCSAMCLGSRS